MESMRSLNKSLPSSQPSRQAPPEQLLQAFRTAALSVTNLYKSAVTDQSESRRAGYQEALEDLLKFLDQENLGVQDGEGWRIRQWATQRYEGGNYQQQSDTDDEQSEPDQRQEATSSDTAPTTEAIPASPVEETIENEDQDSENIPRLPMYQFRGNSHSEPPEMQTDEPSSSQATDAPSSSSPAAPIRVEVRNRSARPGSRPLSSRPNARPAQRDFTFTSGTKRKIQFPDFFDISNVHEGRDGPSGGNGPKRGRFV